MTFVVVLFIASLVAYAQTQKPARVTWEYSTVSSSSVSLNDFGNAGWELVAVIGSVCAPGNSCERQYYFKRQK